jgi:predicted NAD/FAD-dependent oxidoreductase
MIMTRRIPDIAIVGGGVAGLACAARLAESGLQVQVFDKGRRPGGRVAKRQRGNLSFAHGAPGLQHVVDRLLERVSVASTNRVTRIERLGDGNWRLHVEGHPRGSLYAGLVLALPAPQAVDLLGAYPHLVARLESVVMQPTLVALAGLPGPLGRAWDTVRFNDPSLAEARRQPGQFREGPEGWVLEATPCFSADNLECDPDAVARHLWQRFRVLLDLATPAPIYLRGHRWRFARTEQPLGQDYLHDDDLGLGLCGDWCLGHGVEFAQASGRSLAARILGIPERPSGRRLATREGQA